MNSLYQQLNPTRAQLPSNLANIKKMMNMFKGVQNPQQMMSTLMNQNPQMKDVMTLVQNSNMPPKDLFYKLAQEKGVNPDEIIQALQQ